MHPGEVRGKIAIQEIDNQLREAVKAELEERAMPFEALQKEFAINKVDLQNIITGRQVALARLIMFAGALGCEMKFSVVRPGEQVEDFVVETPPQKKKRK